jgi:hypothetical protein
MDLNERMERLRNTVAQGTIRRNEEAERQRQITRAEKARDWNRILDTQPEAAEFVTEVAKEFGKPERVMIWNETKILLDSRKYDSLHDCNRRGK